MNPKVKRRLYALGGLFLAAILPILLYKIVKNLSADKVHMPAYYHPVSVQKVEKNGEMVDDTVYHKVADFKLTNQLGKEFDLYRDTRNKITVAHLFFCNCATICPQLTEHAEALQFAYRKRDSLLRILSITVDPVNDTVPAIRAYAQKRNANHDVWYFLTGDRKKIYSIARDELFLDSSSGDGGEEDFVHSEKFVLLDFNKHIRGYYNGLDSLEMIRLMDDITILALEKNPKP